MSGVLRPVYDESGGLIGFKPRASQPRYRYWQKRNGPMFCYSTEKIEQRYASFVYRPVGPGSRTGQAETFELDDDSISTHQLRKDAKARAYKLYQASLA